MQFSKGFTLLELLIVVAIIAILAGIALPTYQKNSTRARVSELVRVLDSLTQQVIQSYNAKGKMPATLENVDGVGLIGNGDYGAYVIPNMTTHLHYDNGTNWTNTGAVVQVAISSELGKGIPGFIESSNGKNGVGNSISMAFFEDNGTLKIYCGRWDSSAINIPLEFLPTGCNSDNIQDSVTGN